MNCFEIRPILSNEIDTAIELALRVFMEFEAPGYSDEGIESFKSFIFSDEFKNYFIEENNFFVGYFFEKKLIGIVAMRSDTHVSLAFVDKEFHRKGIATQLFNKLFDDRKSKGIENITLNSSPFGVSFYHAIGFVDTDIEQTQDGITYTPMIFNIK